MKKMNEKRSPTPSCAKINYPKGLTSWELDISSQEVFYWLQGLSWSSVATPLSTLQTSSTEHLKNTRMGLQPTVFAETQSIKKHFLTMILLQGKDGLALKRCTRSPRKRCTGWKSLWHLGIGLSMLATMTGWRWDVFDCSPRGNNSSLFWPGHGRKSVSTENWSVPCPLLHPWRRAQSWPLPSMADWSHKSRQHELLSQVRPETREHDEALHLAQGPGPGREQHDALCERNVYQSWRQPLGSGG